MVIGYLDIFVFEELGFAVGPVVDGIDGVIQTMPGVLYRMKSTVASTSRARVDSKPEIGLMVFV